MKKLNFFRLMKNGKKEPIKAMSLDFQPIKGATFVIYKEPLRLDLIKQYERQGKKAPSGMYNISEAKSGKRLFFAGYKRNEAIELYERYFETQEKIDYVTKLLNLSIQKTLF